MGNLPPFKLLLIAVFISFGGPFHFGFQALLTNPAQKAIMAFVNASHINHYGWEMSHSLAESVWSITVAMISVGGIFGSLSIGFISTKVGRKRGLYVSIGLNITGSTLAIISYYVGTFECYIISRIIIGYAVSLSLGLSALLLNESSPKSCRGFISMMSCHAATGGAVVAAIVAMPSIFGKETLWWYLYLADILMLFPLVIALPFIPESPGYLTLHGDEVGARKAILFFHNCDLSAVDGVLIEIKENIKLQSTSISLGVILKDNHLRIGVVVGCVISAAMSLSGSSTVNAFAVTILVNCGLSVQEALYGNIGLMAIMLVFSTAASFAVDRYGRRPLILTSCSGLIVFNIAVFALMYCFENYKVSWIGYTLIGVIAMTKFFFAIGLGPLCFFVASEMVGQSARGVSQTCATTSQMIARTVCIAVFLTLKEAVGQSFAFLILFVAPMVFSAVFLYFNMPETKNKNHKEVIEAMDSLPSISKCCSKRERQQGRIYTIPAYIYDTFNHEEKF